MCTGHAVWYLVLSGNVVFMSLFYLLEFVFETFELNLHLLHKLHVFLSPLVQNLNGLAHVLHLDGIICHCGVNRVPKTDL